MQSNGVSKPSLVIIGNGMVGHRFVQEALRLGLDSSYAIRVIGEEPRLAYDRVNLSKFFDGKTADDLCLVLPREYEARGVEVLLGDGVVAIDGSGKTLRTASGASFGYDKLVIAAGSRPFVPEVRGNDLERCFVYRNIEDLESIRAAATDARRGVVIGGGLLGLEAANALLSLGLETHVVEFAPRLMPLQVDEIGGALLRSRIEQLGVSVHLSKATTEIVANASGRVTGLRFGDGSELDTDLVVFSAGIRARDELGRSLGLALYERGGILVDASCRTSDPNVFAIGECVVHGGKSYGLVAPGYRMAEVAAKVIAGEEARFDGFDTSTKLKLLGVDVASFGDAFAKTPASKVVSLFDSVAGAYKKLVLSEDSKRVLGGILVGDASGYSELLAYMQNSLPVPEHPEDLIVPPREGKTSGGFSVDALPDAAMICSCHNIDKGKIQDSIRQKKLTTLGSVKSCTKAGTGCGSCASLVDDLLKCELKRAGVVVTNHLCEHFEYSRQDLYQLVRVHQIRTFDELILRHGSGQGCEICKPTVASILASAFNEYILKNEHAGLQDTNDRFLGNIQRDGTYSVVPRIAAGEVTPDQLIALGQVAKKYALYTKITGGQRIDLFGARIDQLPSIWRELIDAGFESGHAYGKALRTVKSCVGSTWCRYGVQDSVALALRLENRYKGLRSPHKLKGAVSGCARECAEAQSKDFGVIATEKGYNLYVCGNGGMKPQHALLLASDLDADSVVMVLDRFLMFYIKTADRLQRTATWLNKLEGGFDYLKQVVIEDSLGIGAELEQQMEHVVQSYQCEWKTTISDPEKLSRFRSFLNTDASDPSIVVVSERGQNRPAQWEEKRALVESGRIRLPMFQEAT